MRPFLLPRTALLAVTLALAACGTDAPSRLTVPEGPRGSTGTASRVSVHCPAEMYPGTTATCSAAAYDASNQPISGALVYWSSSDPYVASVGSFGAVQANHTGYTWIEARVDGAVGAAPLRVLDALPPLGLAVDGPSSISAEGAYAWQARVLNPLSGETVTYRWEASTDGSTWSQVSSTGSYQRTLASGDPSFRLRLTGTSNALRSPRSSTVEKAVAVANPLGPGLAVSISGPFRVRSNQKCGYFGEVSGGTPPYVYSWSAWPANSENPAGEPSAFYAWSTTAFDVFLTVTDAAGARLAAPAHRVTISASAPAFCIL